MKKILIVLAVIVFSVLFIWVCFFRFYSIPTPAMEQSLLVGDYIYSNQCHNTFLKSVGLCAEINLNDIVIFRFPVDGNTHYIKRCVAKAGNEFELKNGQVFINGNAVENPQHYQERYLVKTKNNAPLSINKLRERFGISSNPNENVNIEKDTYLLTLTKENADKIKQIPVVEKITASADLEQKVDDRIFPFDTVNFKFTRDNYGPITIPKKGETIDLNPANIALYKDIVTKNESLKLTQNGQQIIIDGKPITSYTFTMDYYFMMGDNRHNSLDSRYWGFVPENHIVGQPFFILMSLDKLKQGFSKIRSKRFFKSLESVAM